jgi:hypothetical protein
MTIRFIGDPLYELFFFLSLYLTEDNQQEFAANGCPARGAAANVKSAAWTKGRPPRGHSDGIPTQTAPIAKDVDTIAELTEDQTWNRLFGFR